MLDPEKLRADLAAKADRMKARSGPGRAARRSKTGPR